MQTNLGLLFTALETNNAYNSRIILFGHLRNIRKDPSRSEFLNLKNLLRACWPYGATGPRDKVYAILSLIVDGKLEDLLPDYSVPVEELYRILAVYVINDDKNLDFLNFCAPDHDIHTPSWVPDWSVVKPYREIIRPKLWMLPSICVYSAIAKRATTITFSSKYQHLVVEGIEIDVIIEASEQQCSVIRRALNNDEDHNIAIAWSEFLFPREIDES